jgi:hypothetical protein
MCSSKRVSPNQALHTDRGRILVSRDTTPLQRPRRVNCCVRASLQKAVVRPRDVNRVDLYVETAFKLKIVNGH